MTDTPAPAPALTDAQRAALQEKLQRLESAKAEIEKARRPFERAIEVLQEQIDALLEDHGIDGEVCCNCARCERLLLPGDLGHSDASGDYTWCETCAPTWADVLAQYQECVGMEPVDQDPEDFALGLQTAQARVHAGDADKKHVWVLA